MDLVGTVQGEKEGQEAMSLHHTASSLRDLQDSTSLRYTVKEPPQCSTIFSPEYFKNIYFTNNINKSLFEYFLELQLKTFAKVINCRIVIVNVV